MTDEYFVRKSLELNLFFLRIMKEHAIFLEAGFTPRDRNQAMQADAFKKGFEGLLAQAVSLADGHISPAVLASGEIVTEFTLEAESMTEKFTGIPINSNITRAELALTRGSPGSPGPMLVRRVSELNSRALSATRDLAEFKACLYRDVLRCKIFTTNYPSLIHHVLTEARHYMAMLNRLQNRESPDILMEAIDQQIFWDHIMEEHALFIRGLLDPSEETLIDTADEFSREFEKLTGLAMALKNQTSLFPEVTEKTLEATREFRDFKRQGAQGILACRIQAIILPLLADHVLREANHYLRLLRIYSGGQ